MELRRYFTIALRYWRVLVVLPLIAAVVALGATYEISPRYQGVATVQLIPDSVEPRTVTLRSQGGPPTVALGLTDPTELLAQGVIENLGSRPVSEAIVDQLGLDQLPEPTGFDALKSQIRGAIGDAMTLLRYGYVVKVDKREAMIGVVEGSVEAQLVRGSYYMRIVTTWNDPEAAADVTNAAVAALVEHTRTVASSAAREQTLFLEQQVSDARQRANQARAEVVQYSQQQGVVAGDTLRQALDGLDRAREALRQNDVAMVDTDRQLQELQRQLASTAANVTTSTTQQSVSQPQTSTTQTAAQNPLAVIMGERVNELERDIAALEVREGMSLDELRVALDADIAENQRRLEVVRRQLEQPLADELKLQLRDRALSLEQEIAALEARRGLGETELRAANRAALVDGRRRLEIAKQQLSGLQTAVVTTDQVVTSGGGSSDTTAVTVPNPVFQALQSRGLELEQEGAALRARRATLQAAVDARDQEVRSLTAYDGQLSALTQELSLANEVYARRSAQWADALLEQLRPVSPVRVIDPARPPLYPVQPIKILWVGIGVVAGLVLAVVLVFLRHTTDMRLRSAQEVEDALQLELLTIVPTARPRAKRSNPESKRGTSEPGA